MSLHVHYLCRSVLHGVNMSWELPPLDYCILEASHREGRGGKSGCKMEKWGWGEQKHSVGLGNVERREE